MNDKCINDILELVKSFRKSFSSYTQLVEDLRVVKSDEIKKIIQEKIDNIVPSAIEGCDKIEKIIQDSQKEESERLKLESKPVYFDILRNGQIDGHVCMPDGLVLGPNDKLIRSYNSKNVVQFEDPKLGYLCDDYNMIFKKCMNMIQKKLHDGQSNLGISTKFKESTPGYANFEEGALTKEDLDKVSLSESETLPDEFVKTYKEIDNNLGKFESFNGFDQEVHEISSISGEVKIVNTGFTTGDFKVPNQLDYDDVTKMKISSDNMLNEAIQSGQTCNLEVPNQLDYDSKTKKQLKTGKVQTDEDLLFGISDKPISEKNAKRLINKAKQKYLKKPSKSKKSKAQKQESK